MSTDDIRLLAERASLVEGRPADRLEELHGRIRTARRRRGAAAAAGAAGLVCAIVATAALLPGSEDRSREPIKEPTPTSPIPMAGIDGPLEPGAYAMPRWESEEPLAVVDVPAGYFSPGGWVLDAGYDGIEPDQYGELTFYPAHDVFRDPCARTRTYDPGPTAEDLARAIASQPGITTTDPEPVTIDGRPGFHLRLTVPESTDLSACLYGTLSLWRIDAEDTSGVELDRTDLTDHLWILDVDGQRVVMSVRLFPDQAPGQNAELLSIARGTRFVTPSEPSE